MAWLEPADPYNPFTRRNYSGLTGWMLSNSALQNLASTTQSLVEQKKPEETPRSSSFTPSYSGYDSGQGFGHAGYGQSTSFGQWAGNIATGLGLLGGPLGAAITAGRIGGTMIADPDRTSFYGLSDAFGGHGPEKGPAPPSLDQYDPQVVGGFGTFGDVTGKPGPQSLGDMAFGPSPENDPMGGGKADYGADPSLEGGISDGSKGETPADGGTKLASGGLLDYPTPGMADNINIGGNYVSGGEYIVPADFVAMLGDGNTEAGGRKLDEAIDRLRKMKYGRKRQPPRFKGTLEDLL